MVPEASYRITRKGELSPLFSARLFGIKNADFKNE